MWFILSALLSLTLTLTISIRSVTARSHTLSEVVETMKVIQTITLEVQEANRCTQCVDGMSKRSGGFYEFTFTQTPFSKGGLNASIAEARFCSCPLGEEARLKALSY